jgi:hypothetical protein
MYDYINHQMKAVRLSSGYLVSRRETKSKFEYGQMAKAIQDAMTTYQGKLNEDEYIVICRASKCIRVCQYFAFGEDACKYAKSTKNKRYLNVSTWQLHAVSLRRTILDLLLQ